MSSRLEELFNDEKTTEKIKRKLPYLFQIAELESSRAGKIGMEVGSLRERILTALLIYKFGEENIETEIPITEAEIDLRLFGKGISIKTITGKSLNGVKLIWTVDAKKAKEFLESYYPKYDILLAQINWNGEGALFFLPVSSQLSAFKKIGREEYIKLPKEGTNPRGVEISHKALSLIVGEKGSRKIAIEWTKREIEFNAFDRWVDYWRED